MRKSVRVAGASFLLLALLASGTVLWRQKSLEIITLDAKPILVEVAQTAESQRTGLSGRNQLANGRGMLFAFGEPSAACMWMKDMNFDLDVYWYTSTGQLISKKENIQPESFPRLYCPEVPASYMIEVNSGEFAHPPKKLIFHRPI